MQKKKTTIDKDPKLNGSAPRLVFSFCGEQKFAILVPIIGGSSQIGRLTGEYFRQPRF